MVRDIRSIPRRLRGCHLDDAAPEGPDVAGSAVGLAADHLGGHEGDGALE